MDDLDGIFGLPGSSQDAGGRGRAAEALREQFEKSRRGYVDVSGDGTRWKVSGTRHAISFATGEVELRPDGLATVRVDAGQAFRDPERARFARKLFSSYNGPLKFPGLYVDDGGRVVFRSEPFDPVADMSADQAVGFALSTVHAYSYVWAALEAGVDPWDLLEPEPWQSPRPGGDGDAPAGRDEGLERLLREFRESMGLADDTE